MSKATKEPEIKAGVRIDGGKRRDLNKERVVGRMAALPEQAPTSEQAKARRKALDKRLQTERAAARNGQDGARTSKVKVRDLQGQRARTLTQTVRCRPGTFEWQYGRNKQDVLFHAGSHFAKLWEKAGMTVSSSADFLRGTASGYAQGISETRVAAMDKLLAAHPNLGNIPFNRLVDYCVRGLTTREMAKKYDSEPRAMGHVLHQDLRACAVEFQFLRPGRAA
ncbi:MAG: hypothetical protein WA973_00550 [Mesorhizobium sp.]